MGEEQLSMEALLRAKDLSIGYSRKAIRAHIDLELRRGELVALVGANGIGKSTLLRTLAGLLPALAGGVHLGSVDLLGMSAQERARNVSVVLTGRPVLGNMDVRTLVSLGRQPWTDRWGGTTARDEQAIEEALDRVGAGHLMHRALDTCSDGECQKVMIARALAQSTPVMLLDEPTAYLDLPNRAAIVRMLRAIAMERDQCVFFSTHDLQLAMDLCDRLVLMRPDGPLWVGSAAEALSSGELQRAFGTTGISFDPAGGTHRFLR